MTEPTSVSETSDTSTEGAAVHTVAADLPIDYVELREVVTDGGHTVDVTANSVNGMVEMWIDPRQADAPAVANLRCTPHEALALGRALTAAGSALRLSTPGKTYDHEPRPDDSAESGDRCRTCGEDITWAGPDLYADWLHVDDEENR